MQNTSTKCLRDLQEFCCEEIWGIWRNVVTRNYFMNLRQKLLHRRCWGRTDRNIVSLSSSARIYWKCFWSFSYVYTIKLLHISCLNKVIHQIDRKCTVAPFSGTFKENFSWFLSRVSEHPFKQNKNVKQHDYMYLYCLLKCAKINLFSITYFQYI